MHGETFYKRKISEKKDSENNTVTSMKNRK